MEVEAAIKICENNFFFLKKGWCVITDPNLKKYKESEDDEETNNKEKKKPNVIAVIEFTCWEDLTEKDKDNLNFLSQFLHGSKKIINPVKYSSCSWGGKMWAIGWRKSQDFR
jgi:hypothetical protein